MGIMQPKPIKPVLQESESKKTSTKTRVHKSPKVSLMRSPKTVSRPLLRLKSPLRSPNGNGSSREHKMFTSPIPQPSTCKGSRNSGNMFATFDVGTDAKQALQGRKSPDGSFSLAAAAVKTYAQRLQKTTVTKMRSALNALNRSDPLLDTLSAYTDRATPFRLPRQTSELSGSLTRRSSIGHVPFFCDKRFSQPTLIRKSPDGRNLYRHRVKLSTKPLTGFKEFQLSSAGRKTSLEVLDYNSDNKIFQLEKKLGMLKEQGPEVD